MNYGCREAGACTSSIEIDEAVVAGCFVRHPGYTVVHVVQAGCDGNLCQGGGFRDDWG